MPDVPDRPIKQADSDVFDRPFQQAGSRLRRRRTAQWPGCASGSRCSWRCTPLRCPKSPKERPALVVHASPLWQNPFWRLGTWTQKSLLGSLNEKSSLTCKCKGLPDMRVALNEIARLPLEKATSLKQQELHEAILVGARLVPPPFIRAIQHALVCSLGHALFEQLTMIINHSVAFCSPAKSLTLSGLMENPLVRKTDCTPKVHEFFLFRSREIRIAWGMGSPNKKSVSRVSGWSHQGGAHRNLLPWSGPSPGARRGEERIQMAMFLLVYLYMSGPGQAPDVLKRHESKALLCGFDSKNYQTGLPW